jgi:iron complex outermembrane recepter protein
MMRQNSVWFALALSPCTPLCAQPSLIRHAQAAEERGQGSPSQPSIAEVVVTAQKRTERLIDTPQSVSVVSADDIGKMAATQFRDFANTIPGLNFSTAGAGYSQISLRGVTSGVDTNPTVGVYVDDVPYGSSTAFAYGGRLALDVGLFDLERIEVLRGPQGTLYGASTMGGLIKYVSKEPDDLRWGTEVQTGISSTEKGGVSFNAAGAINAPLVEDKLALRASAFESHDGGYIDNVALGRRDVNKSDVYGGRLDLLFTPTEAFRMRLNAFAQTIARDGQGAADYGLSRTRQFGSLSQSRMLPENFDQKFRLVSATLSYDLGPTEVTSVSSYQTVRMESMFDLSARFVPLFEQFFGESYSAVGDPVEASTDKFTQEIRMSSKGSSTLQWLFGGFYTHEDSGNDESFVLLDPTGQPAPNIWFSYSAPTKYEEYAGFGDLTFHLNQALDITAGVRYARNEQRFEQIGGSGLFDTSIPEITSTESVTTYLSNVRYRFGENATTYLRFATGYRPGGPNFVALDPNTGDPLAPANFESDELKSYEAGIKLQTGDGRFGLDAALYYIDWDNMQVLTNRGGFGVRLNASGATIRGAELTLAARAANRFTATGAFAYQDPKMSSDTPELQAVENERLPDVPRFTASVNADYILFQSGFEPTVGATVRHVSDRVASFSNSVSVPQYRLPEYTSVDLRSTGVVGSVVLQLYIRNVFDERGELSAFTGYASLGGPAQVSLLQPRTYGMSAAARF